MNVTLYHNPRCSKSRETLELLEARGANLEIIRYLDAPPTADDLREMVRKLDVPAAALVRTGDDAFKGLGIDPSSLDDEDRVIDLLVQHPELLQRPIAVTPEAARLGRPPEHVLELLK